MQEEDLRGLKKNLLPFKNTTLLGNSIKQSKKCKIISDTYVSTENNKIIKEAEKNKAKIILRPKKLSTSTAHEIDAWKHAIIYLKKKKLLIQRLHNFATYLWTIT